MQIIVQKLGKYISVHHARFEMFSALMHIVTVDEGVLTLQFTIFWNKRN